ncbi:hypothetical protein HDV00_003378, partial [Rhizophlyctis rosea]
MGYATEKDGRGTAEPFCDPEGVRLEWKDRLPAVPSDGVPSAVGVVDPRRELEKVRKEGGLDVGDVAEDSSLTVGEGRKLGEVEVKKHEVVE